jgi:hypothetical protein
MSDKRAAKASRAALLQTKELQEPQELPLQSQRSCQQKNFFSQKIKTLKPKQKRERERAKKLDNKWTRVNIWKGSRASSRASVCKLLQREEGGKGELIVRKHELEEGS